MDIPFDLDHYVVINKAREAWLKDVIRQLPIRDELTTALDVGCGAGFFSGVLQELGFSVEGMDLREENLALCRDRYPTIPFRQVNLDLPFELARTYDMVLLFGILYHLQSPLQTILNLAKSIGRLAIISTRTAPGNEMACYLYQEYQGMAHNHARITAVPTFPALLAMFNQAGFPHIYRPEHQPDHPQWRPDQTPSGLRHCFIISREKWTSTPKDWAKLTPPDAKRKWE